MEICVLRWFDLILYSLIIGALVDGTSTMLDYSKYILPTGIFLFKFLEWWYSENQNLVTQQQPIPPPPEPPKVLIHHIYIILVCFIAFENQLKRRVPANCCG